MSRINAPDPVKVVAAFVCIASLAAGLACFLAERSSSGIDKRGHIGSFTEGRKRIHINSMTGPMPSDLRSRDYFSMSDSGHQAFVNNSFYGSDGTMLFLGTWRTCPYPDSSPAVVDKEDWWLCKSRNARRHPLLFVIVATDQVGVYLPWGEKFVPLKEANK